MTSIIGQRGNESSGSAASLANELTVTLSDSHASGLVLTDDMRSVFEQVQDIRAPRPSEIMKVSHQRKKMHAIETLELEDLVMNRFLKLLPGIMLERWDKTYRPAVSLKMFPMPNRPKLIPFQDETTSEKGEGVNIVKGPML